MSEIFISYKSLSSRINVPDLNRNPTKSTSLPHFMLRGMDEYWKDAVCADHGFCAVEDLSSDCGALRWRLPSSHFPLCQAIPRLGICAADVSRELARHRSLPLRASGQALPRGYSLTGAPCHAWRCGRMPRMTHLCRHRIHPLVREVELSQGN